MVVLREAFDGWPAGTVGAAVLIYSDAHVLVEAGTEADDVLDRLVCVPTSLLDVKRF